MTASAVAAHGDPLILLVLIVVVLGGFGLAGGFLWLLGREEERRELLAGRDVLRHAEEIDQ